MHQHLLQDCLFQSTHSQGVRLTKQVQDATAQIFQSTHSQGVRPNNQVRAVTSNDFNPRTHKECDKVTTNHITNSVISIHALTRSATVMIGKIRTIKGNFNPRTHKECDGL